MGKRLELNLSDEIFEKIEVYRINNNFEDKQDVIYDLLRDKFLVKKSFFQKLKDLFN